MSDKELLELEIALEKIPDDLLLKLLLERESVLSVLEQQASIVHSQSFSGPLPPPQILKHYEQVHSGFADRIMQMAEKEQNHRHQQEIKILAENVSIKKRGQIFALTICSLVVAASFALIWTGHEVSGSVLATGSLSALAYVFISGRSPKKTK